MWDWPIWVALIVAGLAGTAALALLVVRLLQGWRDFKRLRRHVFRGLDDLAAAGERAADKAALAADTEELQASLVRLRRSLARLAVLREALDEAQEAFGRFAWVMPRR